MLEADVEKTRAVNNGTQRLFAGRLKARLLELGLVCEVVFGADVEEVGAPGNGTEILFLGR